VTGYQLFVVVPTRKRFDSDGDKGYSAFASSLVDFVAQSPMLCVVAVSNTAGVELERGALCTSKYQ
jgi:hypothetical protein